MSNYLECIPPTRNKLVKPVRCASFSHFTIHKSDSIDVVFGNITPIRHKIGARWGSGSWHCPTHHWRTFCDREHPKFPWLRVRGCRWGAYPCDHIRLDQFVQPTKISPNVDETDQGHRWWKHPFASLLIQRAWLAVPQLFWHRCCGRVQLAHNDENLTIFKPNSNSCLVWNGVWRLMMHNVCWKWFETKTIWCWSSNPKPSTLNPKLYLSYKCILFMAFSKIIYGKYGI